MQNTIKICKPDLPENKNTFAFALVVVQVVVSVVRVWDLTLVYAVLASKQSCSLGIMMCQSCVKRPE